MEAGQRSYGRWYILGLICLMYMITYLDRVIMSNTAPEIQQEFGIDNFTKGLILTPFSGAIHCFKCPAAGSPSALVRASYWRASSPFGP